VEEMIYVEINLEKKKNATRSFRIGLYPMNEKLTAIGLLDGNNYIIKKTEGLSFANFKK
jgi:hypothetical protein